MTLENFNEVIDFAVDREKDAVAFYTDLQDMAKFAAQKEMLAELADMERGHIMMLETLRAKGPQEVETEQAKTVPNLKISEYLVEAPPTANMTYQDILVTAMKREEKSYALYTKMAQLLEGQPSSYVLMRIAQEEAGHKLRFEKLYDEEVLKDN